MNEKQSISSEEVGSLEDVLGKNDPIFRPVLEPEVEPEVEPKIQDPTEHYRAKKGIK